MIDISSICEGLELGDDGIWYSDSSQKISYSKHGNDDCFNVEDNSFWFKHRNSCITTVVKKFGSKSETIFDIGGGNGYVSLGLQESGYDVVVVEPGKNGARNAKKRGLSNVVCSTTDTAQFKPNTLPAIGLFDVVEHIEDDVGFLKSIRCMLKEDGYVYISVPAYSALWSADDVSAGHYRRYTTKGMSSVLQSAGFDVVFSSYIFRFLPVPIFFLRALPYKLGIKPKKNTRNDHVVQSGLKVELLNKLLNSEIDNLDHKVSMGFGGSCLIVAKST